MNSSFDISQYIGVFLDEAEEQLQVLNDGFLALEKEGGNNDLLNKVFRAAHTIKGSSASLGFEKIASLTHEMESLLDKIRKKDLSITTPITDALLNCLDNLHILKEEITSGEDKNINIEPLLGKLRALQSQQNVQVEIAQEKAGEAKDFNLSDIEANLIREAEVRGFSAFYITVTLEKNTVMKSVRAYLVVNNIKELGEIIKSIPSTEEIEEEKFDDCFSFVFVTKEDADKIRHSIMSLADIAEVEIEPIILQEDNNIIMPINESATTLAEQKEELQNVSAVQTITAVQAVAKKPAQTVRVDVQRLENLMNLVGELVIDRTRLTQIGSVLKTKLAGDESTKVLEELSIHLSRITGDLQEEIMKARMLPVEQVFNRFPRMVRDLAQKAGKEIEFIVEGKETELDRTVIEEIGDPLIHLIRNGVDHGIESPEERSMAGKPVRGVLRLSATHRENHIIITVADDGKGMDPQALRDSVVKKGLFTHEAAAKLTDMEAINLIFYPGFSTAKVISDVSGRGVGMDIVRNHIEKINGMIEIETKKGVGTKFIIKLPLTLAIIQALMVKTSGQTYAIPLVNVVEILLLKKEEVQRINSRDVVVVRGKILPIVELNEVLGYSEEASEDENLNVVVVGIGERRFGFLVHELLGEQEVVIKSLGKFIGHVEGIAGATILGDGSVAVILDIRGVINNIGAE